MPGFHWRCRLGPTHPAMVGSSHVPLEAGACVGQSFFPKPALLARRPMESQRHDQRATESVTFFSQGCRELNAPASFPKINFHFSTTPHGLRNVNVEREFCALEFRAWIDVRINPLHLLDANSDFFQASNKIQVPLHLLRRTGGTPRRHPASAPARADDQLLDRLLPDGQSGG